MLWTEATRRISPSLVWEMGGSPLVVSSPVLWDPPVVVCGLPPWFTKRGA